MIHQLHIYLIRVDNFANVFDSLSSVSLLLKITLSDSLLLVEQNFNKFSIAMIYFYLLLFKSQTYEIGIYCVPVISVLTGSMLKLKSSALIIHLASYIFR